MKKIVLSLAGVLAATAFAPEAAAVPSFARQTGMACSACHFQHFPVLNSFGRAFKAGGYTMMGSQGKVENEHLSIPDTLNGSMLVKIRYQKSNAQAAAGTPNGLTTATGQWQIPDEFSLFFGGRIGENVGFLNEINLAGTSPNTGGVAAQFKLPFVFDMGGMKLSAIPFMSDAGSMAYGYELSSTGVVRALRWSEERSAITAANYVGMNSGEATGLAFVAQNDMGYINVTRWSPHYSAGGGAGQAIQLRNNWLRVAATPTVADWAMHIGVGVASGSSEHMSDAGDTTVAPVIPPTFVKTATKATLIDFQGQTTLGANDLSVYASYGSAPASTATESNKWNTGTANAKTAMGVGADYSVIPHVLHVGGAFLSADNGKATKNKETKIMVQAIYDMTENTAFHVTFVKSSGTAYDGAAVTSPTNTTLMLETSW